jgi:hypothetical protein
MKFKYVGPHDAVDLVDVGTVAHGETVEVTGDAAQSLAAQADWKRVDKPKTQTPAESATKNEE